MGGGGGSEYEKLLYVPDPRTVGLNSASRAQGDGQDPLGSRSREPDP
jgi:hypothetical protein